MGDCSMKSSQYPMRVLSELCQLYNEAKLVDTTVTLAESGTVFTAHKCVLVAAFPYFKKLMENEQLYEKITLKSIASESFQDLLNFAYTGELQINQSNVKAIMKGAERMQVPEAMSLCRQFMCQDVGQSEGFGASVTEDLGVELDLVSESINEELEPVDRKVKTEPEVSEPTVEAQPIKRGRGRPRGKARQVLQENIPETSPRRDSHKSAATASDDSYKPPQVPAHTKRKLHQLEKSERRKRKGRQRDSDFVEVPSDTELNDGQDEDYRPADKPGRKRGRPKKDKSVESPSKRIKQEMEDVSPVRKSPSKRGRKPCASSSHVESIPMIESLPTISCAVCSSRFYHHSALHLHEHKHNIFRQLSTVVKYHNAKFRLLNGLRICSNQDSSGYVCTWCNKTFKLRSQCLAHVVKLHRNRRKCKRCSRNIGIMQSQLLHRCRKSKAISSKVHPCSSCSRVFLNQSLLSRHTFEHHSGEDQAGVLYTCRHCTRSFSKKTLYICHLLGHGLTDGEVQQEFTDPDRVPLRGRVLKVVKDESHDLPFQCPSCPHRYKELVDLNTHMMSKHNQRAVLPKPRDKAKRIRCEEGDCEESFSQMKDLRQHIATQHPECLYECYQCNYNTTVKRLLRSHLKYKHTTIEDRTCQVCGKHFKKRYHYKIHMVSKHGADDADVKVFRCEVEGCDYKTYAKYVLDIHMKKHDKEKNFACNICGRKLKSQKAVEKHTNKVHKGIRPFICDICGASYGEEHELKMHIVRHNDVKQYQCEHCEYATHDKGNFQNHLFTRHKIKEGRFARDLSVCSICGYSTGKPLRFLDHMNMHNQVRPFKCSDCGEAFYSQGTLKDHIKWKHNKSSFKCDYCSFTGPTKYHVAEHTRYMHTHRELKPYKCAYCDYRCNVSGNCRKHILSKHKGQEVKWVKVCAKYPKDYSPTKVVTTVATKQGKSKAKGKGLKDGQKGDTEGTNIGQSTQAIDGSAVGTSNVAILHNQGAYSGDVNNLLTNIGGQGIILQSGQIGGQNILLQNQGNMAGQFSNNDVFNVQIPAQNQGGGIVQFPQHGEIESVTPIHPQSSSKTPLQQGTYNVIGEIKQIAGAGNYGIYQPAQLVLATPQQQGQNTQTVMLNVSGISQG